MTICDFILPSFRLLQLFMHFHVFLLFGLQ